MKKWLKGLLGVLMIILVKLIMAFMVNEIIIYNYNNNIYNLNLVKSLYFLNFSQSYIAYYNDGNLFERDDFYTVISKEKLGNGLTVEDVRKKIEARESFSLEYKLDGQERIMVCTPMTDVEWYCIISVPLSIYQEQSSNMLRMMTVLITLIMIAVFIVIILVFRNHSQKNSMKFEIKHRDELENALA